ncbi:diguanylate cyclase [Paenibacillus athensensis]|uniref:Diguanylate cyclase n=2 Tax=Paenibacillus athensensis TaxID=1967502 RepID=A0A4Y8PZ11_9BACL|nr:diguanylate cyclase [Paenibacillus athensensis]
MQQGRKLFIRELEKQIKELRELMERLVRTSEAGDYMRLYRIVHTLKGSAPIFGYTRIGKLAEEVVRMWEWTQAGGGEEADIAALSPLRASLNETPGALERMALEFEISRTELQMDQQQHPAGGSLLGSLKVRLLLVDDDEVLRSYMLRRLQLDECVVDEASDVDTARRLLREHDYDLVILDLMMHPQSGYELFDFLKDDPTLKWLPLIVLSGRNDLGDKVRCFHLGADDYVTKPFQYDELAARIYGLLKRAKNFEQLAFRDALTGVFNRRYFDLQIGIELQRAERFTSPMSLVFIDIDRFKSINDNYGHHVGDLVLQGLAHVLQTNFRSTDLLARFGGEEFVIALPNTTAEQAQTMVQAVLDKVRSQPVAKHEGQSFFVTFSAGIAPWKSGMAVSEWTRDADEAMYQAKQQGRNRVLSILDVAAGLENHASVLTLAAEPRKRLLIVDDDQILRSIVIGKLEHLPIDIVEAADGDEAVELLARGSFDACILDGVMPRLDGFSLLEHIKSEAALGEMKVLMLSAKRKEDDLVKGFRLGADDYMTKPFSLVELEMRVRRLMKL